MVSFRFLELERSATGQLRHSVLVWAATSIAMTLMVAIYAFGSVSGANFNPAVSLALALNNSEEFDWGKAIKHMVAERGHC